jgi:hypothetical protein
VYNFFFNSRPHGGGAPQPGISQTMHVDWIESSEGGAREECRTRNSEVVRSRRLRHFEGFRCVTFVESAERPQRRQTQEMREPKALRRPCGGKSMRRRRT